MRYVILVLILAALPSCASIVGGFRTHERVRVISNVPEARVRGKFKPITPGQPGTILVKKSSNGVMLEITKPGYHPELAMVESHFNGWFIGNFFIGGLFGMIIDIATGCAYYMDDEIVVNLRPTDGTVTDVGPAIGDAGVGLALTADAFGGRQQGETAGNDEEHVSAKEFLESMRQENSNKPPESDSYDARFGPTF